MKFSPELESRRQKRIHDDMYLLDDPGGSGKAESNREWKEILQAEKLELEQRIASLEEDEQIREADKLIKSLRGMPRVAHHLLNTEGNPFDE